MDGIDEVFPICLRAAGRDHWVAWASPEEGDRLLSSAGRAICTDDEAALRSVLDCVLPGVAIENSAYIDVDAVLAQLRSGSVPDPDLVVDAWNLLTDLFRALGAGPRQMFFHRHLDSYSAFFSRSGVAAMVGEDPQVIDPEDVRNAVQVLEAGVTMIVNRDAMEIAFHGS